MPLSLFPQPLAFHSFHFHQLHPPGFTPAHLTPSQIIPPPRVSFISLLFRIRAIHLVLIPVTPPVFFASSTETSPSLPFVYLSLTHVEAIYYYPSPVHCTPTFLSHVSFLKQPCQQLSFFLFRFSFSSILDTTSRISLPKFTLSISQYRLASFLTHSPSRFSNTASLLPRF